MIVRHRFDSHVVALLEECFILGGIGVSLFRAPRSSKPMKTQHSNVPRKGCWGWLYGIGSTHKWWFRLRSASLLGGLLVAVHET